jgi:predicted RNase H-like HicB family nuclease
MATVVYPAIAERTRTGYSVFFPDLPGCTTAGRNLDELARNAESALADHLAVTVSHKEEVAPASSFDDIGRDPEVQEVCRFLVRAEMPGRSVRLNITLDESLVAAIDQVATNRSGFLAEAARQALAARRQLADA